MAEQSIAMLDARQETSPMPTLIADPAPPTASPSVALYGDHMTELAVVLDQMTCPPYNTPPPKLQKAYAAVLEKRVTPREGCPDEAVVASATHPFTVYRTTRGSCDCPYARAHPDERYACTHAVAARLYQRWRQSLAPLTPTPKETSMPRSPAGPTSAPLLTSGGIAVAQAPVVPQEASDDIPEPGVPSAVLEAATAPLEASKVLPVDFQVHEALLSGFCQYLQNKMHTWMMAEHHTLTTGMETTMAGMRDYAKSVLDGNEHAAYQLSDALLKLREQGLPLRHDPYVVDVAARSPHGFAVTIHVSKSSTEEVIAVLPALLDWLTQQHFTPGT